MKYDIKRHGGLLNELPLYARQHAEVAKRREDIAGQFCPRALTPAGRDDFAMLREKICDVATTNFADAASPRGPECCRDEIECQPVAARVVQERDANEMPISDIGP